MRARQRGVTAEVDLHDRCEPAKRPSVGARQQESRLRQIHLSADALHPLRTPLAIEKADRRRIAAEWLVGEGVDLKETHDVLSARCLVAWSYGAPSTIIDSESRYLGCFPVNETGGDETDCD